MILSLLMAMLQILALTLAALIPIAMFYMSEIREWHVTFRTIGPAVFQKEITQTVDALTRWGAKRIVYDEQHRTRNRPVIIVSVKRGERVRDIRRRESHERSVREAERRAARRREGRRAT